MLFLFILCLFFCIDVCAMELLPEIEEHMSYYISSNVSMKKIVQQASVLNFDGSHGDMLVRSEKLSQFQDVNGDIYHEGTYISSDKPNMTHTCKIFSSYGWHFIYIYHSISLGNYSGEIIFFDPQNKPVVVKKYSYPVRDIQIVYDNNHPCVIILFEDYLQENAGYELCDMKGESLLSGTIALPYVPDDVVITTQNNGDYVIFDSSNQMAAASNVSHVLKVLHLLKKPMTLAQKDFLAIIYPYSAFEVRDIMNMPERHMLSLYKDEHVVALRVLDSFDPIVKSVLMASINISDTRWDKKRASLLDMM